MRIFFLLAILLVAAAIWVVAETVLARELNAWELAASTGVAIVLVAAWRSRHLRLQRQKLESIRDSALW